MSWRTLHSASYGSGNFGYAILLLDPCMVFQHAKVRLLGVEMALTGIKPAVAQAIVPLGIDSLGLSSYASMQDAISAQMLDRAL